MSLDGETIELIRKQSEKMKISESALIRILVLRNEKAGGII